MLPITVFVNGFTGAFLEVQALICRSMPTVASAFFPKFVIGIKMVLVGSNQVCVVLEELIVCVC